MQVGSSSSLAAQLQALESAAQAQYQAGSDFDFMVGQAGAASSGPAGGAAGASSGDPTAGATTGAAGAGQLSGSFQSTSLIAVGTVGANGAVQMFSPQQIQGEEDDVAKMRQSAFTDSLQNFMTLAQEGGQMGASSYTDQSSFTGDNGLISASFNSQFSLSGTASS
jgi:hypothetical protein